MMATSPLIQIPTSAIDAVGLSITTAIKSATDPRPGHIYESTNLAAAVPVHFHPTVSPAMGGTSFLMLNSQRWTAATLSASHPGAYTAFTPTSVPNWVQINAATGIKTTINGAFDIPMKTPGTAALTAAVSRGVDMFWTLNEVTNGDITSAVVQHWHNNTAINTINLKSEETIPQGTNGDDAVLFTAGLQWSSTTTPYMYAYGTGSSTNHVYAARKAWARVGYVTTSSQTLDTQWEYFNGTGWGYDPTDIAPVQTASGPLISTGPLSFGHHALQRGSAGMSKGLTGYNFVSTVQSDGSARSAQIYSSLGGRPWTPIGDPITLGTFGSTYLGATLQFQQQVGPNPTMIDSANSAAAIPYVSSILSVVSGASSIVNNWGLLQVPRLS